MRVRCAGTPVRRCGGTAVRRYTVALVRWGWIIPQASSLSRLVWGGGIGEFDGEAGGAS